jgi:Arc/MetJ family transcription regulator
MRTTIKIDDALLAEAKLRAAQSGRTLNSLVEDALREAFARRDAGDVERQELPVFRGSRLQPGADLDDAASLVELMEQQET